jgi:hypothetical protein
MSKKTLLILLVLIAILAVVWGVKGWASRRQGGTKALSIETLHAIDPTSVNEIEISKGEEKVFLKREGEAWKVGEKEADAEKIRKALEAVKGASFTGPVARAKENHDKLGVGEQGEKVLVRQGDASFEFHIGNGGPTYESSYVRRIGEDEVFLADVNLGFQFSTATSTWEKKVEEAKKDEPAD